MKSLLTIFIFSVAVCQVFDIYAPVDAQLFQVNIFYETLCTDDLDLFSRAKEVASDPILKYAVHIDMVPFGIANFTENPFNIACQHGEEECYGNAIHACFFARHPDPIIQTSFVECCMNDNNPPHAGERCAKKLGYSFEGVEECATNSEGIALQIRNGQKTQNFTPSITSVPRPTLQLRFDETDDDESLTNIKKIVREKLNAKGMKI